MLRVLKGDGVKVIVVDGTDKRHVSDDRVEWINREWNIYKTWNHGIDLAKEQGHSTVFVLNDDIVLKPGSCVGMDRVVKECGLAIVSFFDRARRDHLRLLSRFGDKTVVRRETPATSNRDHSICGYAFASNPLKCPRADEEFLWWCGDDELFYRAQHHGAGVGVACCIHVEHPSEGTSSSDIDTKFPYGWKARDFEMLDKKTIGIT